MSKNQNKRTNNMLLPGLEGFETQMLGQVEDNASLEAELLQLVGGAPANSSRSKSDKKTANSMVVDPRLMDLNLDDDDGDVGDIDENDPELLAELNEYLEESDEEEKQASTPVKQSGGSAESVQRLKGLAENYELAVAEAKASKDSSKTRRYERGHKTVLELLSKARKGLPVSEADFPPSVKCLGLTSQQKQPQQQPPKPQQQPSPPKRPVVSAAPATKVAPTTDTLGALMRRQQEYKIAALDAKKSNNIELAKGLMVAVKQFDHVIANVKTGEQFDLDDMPGPPSEFSLSDLDNGAAPAEEPEAAPLVPAPATSGNLGDELQHRLGFYKTALEKAQTENNSGKVRRLGRIVQQYQEAITVHKAGGRAQLQYNYSELAPPPGKTTLSGPTPASAVAAPPVTAAGTTRLGPQPRSQPQYRGAATNHTLALLKDRQVQFKVAALKAKKENDLELAKELLRQSMGLEKMISAAESGLPVDMSQVPQLPTLGAASGGTAESGRPEDECETPSEMLANDSDDPLIMINKLEVALVKQEALCRRYEAEMKRVGDVLGSRRYQEMATSCAKDVEGVRCLRVRVPVQPPAFHYEYRLLSVPRANPELGEDELLVEVVAGRQLQLPDGYSSPEQLDTYVVLTLLFPSTEAPQTFTTETIKHTNSPEYGASNKFQINIKSRVLLRVVRHKPIKADIWYRRGLLQRDKQLGSASLRLTGLETDCNVHECCDLYDGRKLVAGKLELRAKIRHPLANTPANSVQQHREKWLVIDQFNRNAGQVAHQERVTEARGQQPDLGSVDVLRYEVDEMRRVLSASTTPAANSVAASVRQKLREKEAALRQQEERADSQDKAVRTAYLAYLGSLVGQLQANAKSQLATGNRDRAQGIVTRKALVERELERRRRHELLPRH